MSRRPRSRVAAVILAAGTSSRMGDANKLLADVNGSPMVRRAVEALLPVPLIDRVVITGADAEEVREALAGIPVRFVHNPDHPEGIASSIRAGVASLPPEAAGALIMLGDMPWVESSDVRRLVRAFAPGAGRGICVPVKHGRRGNPVLWAARYFGDLRALTGDTGARRLFRRFAGEIHEVSARSEGVLRDIDTPAALDAARDRNAGRDGG